MTDPDLIKARKKYRAFKKRNEGIMGKKRKKRK